MAGDDVPQEGALQSFASHRTPHDALDAAQAYLEGAGVVAPALQGKLERAGDSLVVHHGRVTTRIHAHAQPAGSRLEVIRRGRVPLEETRRWLFGLGVGGFFVGWGLAWYNQKAQEALPPLVTMTLFFLAIFGAIVLLYVIDRSLEKRSGSLVGSLRDAVQGDPLLVLRREVDGLERSSAIANSILAYCVFLILEFIAFAITWGVGTAVDRAAALEWMPASFGLPVVPAALFGALYFVYSNRKHSARFDLVERRFRDVQ